MAKVSVIIPVYNAERYIKQCLDSVVNQTLGDIEIIIINDGSNDRTEEVIRPFLNDPRVKYYKKENEGLAAARQDGIDRSTGEYIGFVDSDDWLEPVMYEKMYEAAVSCNADIVFCNCFENQDKKLKTYIDVGIYDRERIEREILPRTLSPFDGNEWTEVIRWSNCLRLFRRETMEKNGVSFGREFRRCQDLPFTFEMTLCADTYVYLGEDYLYHNRVVPTSLSRSHTKDMWQLLRPLIKRLYSDCENYKRVDLLRQMDACAFMFAVNSISNEAQKGGQHRTLIKKYKNISAIVNDPITTECIHKIDREILPAWLQCYYDGILHKQISALLYYGWRQARFLPWKGRLKTTLRNNKVIYSVYSATFKRRT